MSINAALEFEREVHLLRRRNPHLTDAQALKDIKARCPQLFADFSEQVRGKGVSNFSEKKAAKPPTLPAMSATQRMVYLMEKKKKDFPNAPSQDLYRLVAQENPDVSKAYEAELGWDSSPEASA